MVVQTNVDIRRDRGVERKRTGTVQCYSAGAFSWESTYTALSSSSQSQTGLISSQQTVSDRIDHWFRWAQCVSKPRPNTRGHDMIDGARAKQKEVGKRGLTDGVAHKRKGGQENILLDINFEVRRDVRQMLKVPTAVEAFGIGVWSTRHLRFLRRNCEKSTRVEM